MFRRQYFYGLLVCLVCSGQTTHALEPFVVGAFSSGSLNDWQTHNFTGETHYQIVSDSDGTKVLQASSQNAASGLFRQQLINIRKTPYLNWRWKVLQPLSALPEQSKTGDDFAARMYVVIDGGLLFWQKKSINYVWSSQTPKATVWPNAFAGEAVKMLALRDATATLNTWYTEKRNIRTDLKNLLGLEVDAIDALAVMTDTDNSHGQAKTLYGDIYFSAE